MTATRKIILACLAAMFVAALAAYPLAMVGMEAAAGMVFIAAMVTAWIASAAGFFAWLRRD